MADRDKMHELFKRIMKGDEKAVNEIETLEDAKEIIWNIMLFNIILDKSDYKAEFDEVMI